MTREELILYGKDYLHDLETACCKIEEKHKEFVSESIKALEQETVSRETYESEYLARKQAELELWKIQQNTSKDCISRQAVLEKINDWWGITATSGEPTLCDYIRELPSVTPQPKTGHWIDIMVGDMPAQACDQCNTFYPLAYTGGGHKYCPNCGAEMESEK